MHSSPREQCAMSAARLDCVPDGKKSPASMPKRSAQTACRRLTVGSSPKTSSPTGASAMARRIAGDGWVTVSLRRSIMGRPKKNSGSVPELPLSQRFVHLLQGGAARAELALPQLVQRLRHRIEAAVEVARRVVDVEQPGHDLADRMARLDMGYRGDPVGGVVVGGELPQPDHGAVVLADLAHVARCEFG